MIDHECAKSRRAADLRREERERECRDDTTYPHGESVAATNRLIRWIYDGWGSEIGSWPRVNLARVKVGEKVFTERKKSGWQGKGWKNDAGSISCGIYAAIFYPALSLSLSLGRRRRTHTASWHAGDNIYRHGRFSACRAFISLRFWHAARTRCLREISTRQRTPFELL